MIGVLERDVWRPVEKRRSKHAAKRVERVAGSQFRDAAGGASVVARDRFPRSTPGMLRRACCAASVFRRFSRQRRECAFESALEDSHEAHALCRMGPKGQPFDTTKRLVFPLHEFSRAEEKGPPRKGPSRRATAPPSRKGRCQKALSKRHSRKGTLKKAL
ncbi:hypothetical protein M885DRAFT_248964 [Pelagophyceae sp. CCMP2097]|nr:hypothetical protein M885DRAFT_248964 [Pelagophyceae sp. CCMP2097]